MSRRFSVDKADAVQVAEEIGALRATLSSLQKKKTVVAAAQAPDAVRRLLEIIENLNLRLADLESQD